MSDDERIQDDQPGEEETPQEEPVQEPEEPISEPGYAPGEPEPDTNVYDMLRAAIGLFIQEGWIALGLQPRYGASETQMDLRCAKVAIDTTQLLVEQLGGEADAAEQREFERALTDLRVNFMRRKAKAGESEPAG
jgi:hypothetical protein